MTFEQYKTAFISEATNYGYSEQNIKDCLNYAEKLINKNLPIIYNTTHLSRLVGYKKSYLKRAVLHTKYFYRWFDVQKRNGKKRRISEPLPSLKEIQTWILENILYNIPISRFAKAYIPKMGIKQNVVFHKGQPKILTIDIENFFPSIKINSVEKIFHEVGYSTIISALLAKLCCMDDSLPQGAPTSPYLSNIYLVPADNKISKYCIEKGIRYTRYSDDMTFSGQFDTDELLFVVTESLNLLSLKINNKKTKTMMPNTRQIVTGIVVNEKLQVSFEKRNKIRQEVYYIKKFGLEDHMDRLGIKKANYLAHLLGQVNYIIHINPMDQEFIAYRDYLASFKS